MLTLGFDTSNYTTSVAAFDGVGGKNCSRLLDVRPGELGLRQSDALFAHVKRLPELARALFAEYPGAEITAIGASTRPPSRAKYALPPTESCGRTYPRPRGCRTVFQTSSAR